jgi:thymidine kinase
MSAVTMEPLRSQSRLDILLGSMMAGKTSALLRQLTQLSEMGLSVLYINHISDNRDDTPFSTHSPLLKNQQLDITTIRTNNLSEIPEAHFDGFDVIGIDEAQFFDQHLVNFVKNLVDIHKKYVIVVGLDGNFRREKFGYILDLIPLADNVTKLHAYCKRCAEHKKLLVNALFSHYTAADTNDTVIVGGAEKFEAVCRECYLELTGDQQN